MKERATKELSTTDAFMLDMYELASRYRVGLSTARKIGEQSGGKVKIGKLTRYLVSVTDEYVLKLGNGNKES